MGVGSVGCGHWCCVLWAGVSAIVVDEGYVNDMDASHVMLWTSAM